MSNGTSQIATAIQEASGGMTPSDRANFLNFLNTINIPSPQAAQALADASISGFGGAGLSEIANLPGAPAIQNVLSQYAQEGEAALPGAITKYESAAPTAPSSDVSGFQRASANALSGNVRIPSVETNYIQQSSAQYQNQLQTYQTGLSDLQQGWQTLEAMNDPDTARMFTLAYMNNAIDQVLAKFPEQTAEPLYEQMQNIYSESQQTQQALNNFFTNTLALNFNLSGDINQAVIAQNLNQWVSGLIQKPITSTTPAFGIAPQQAVVGSGGGA